MADYKELLRLAVAALPENNGASRRAVYEKARASLVGQLRRINPPLPARDITTHRLQLEDCIRQVEFTEGYRLHILKQLAELARNDEAHRNAVYAQVRQGLHENHRSKGRAEDDQFARAEKAELERIIQSIEAKELADRPKERVRPPANRSGDTEKTSDTQSPSGASDKGDTKPQDADLTSYLVVSSLFKVPRRPTSPNLVPVMMPFAADLDPVFERIQQAGLALDLDVTRADFVYDNPEIIQDVFSLLYRARIVICDLTALNPNVFYEMGIAHALGRTVIPIVQTSTTLPFNVSHLRVVRYSMGEIGLKRLQVALVASLRAILDRP